MTAPLDDIRDIHGPVLAAPAHAWWPYAIVGIVVFAIVLVVRYVVVRRRRRAVPADVRALLALDAARELIERGDPQAFSTRVSAAVRGYVEEAFALHAPRLTTDELLATLMHDYSPVAAYREQLGAFLEFCDLAKYARWTFSRSDMTRMLDSAEVFVRATAGRSEPTFASNVSSARGGAR